VSIWYLTLGPNHPEYAVGLVNLADTLRRLGRYEESESRFRVALPILERTWGVDGQQLLWPLRYFARTLRSTNKTAEAESVEARVKAILQRTAHSELAALSFDGSSSGSFGLVARVFDDPFNSR
jgi:hypothetical protein